MIQPPCKGCENRQIYCHSEREGYKAWKAERDAEKQACNAEKIGKNQFKSHREEVFRRRVKRKH